MPEPHVIAWLVAEGAYQQQKFPDRSEHIDSLEPDLMESAYVRDFLMYAHRAQILGLSTKRGRQAAAKATAVAVAMLDAITTAYGDLPSAGRPSGDVGDG